ncbi:hypothetical protein F750_5205 [Streptomyces sp. PAMC 26508]|nr:hypothetical protein F750_5205 [Streptomyces sp. PAMC 26508]
MWIEVPRTAGSRIRGYGTGAGRDAPRRRADAVVRGRTPVRVAGRAPWVIR